MVFQPRNPKPLKDLSICHHPNSRRTRAKKRTFSPKNRGFWKPGFSNKMATGLKSKREVFWCTAICTFSQNRGFWKTPVFENIGPNKKKSSKWTLILTSLAQILRIAKMTRKDCTMLLQAENSWMTSTSIFSAKKHPNYGCIFIIASSSSTNKSTF